MDHVFDVHCDIAASARRVVVVGAGYIGLELAHAFTHRSLDVTVVEMLDQVCPPSTPELADELRATLEDHGVTVATGVTVEAIEPGGAGLRKCY